MEGAARAGPRRVAHLISSRGVGGAEKVVRALCEAASRRDWEAAVVNPFEDSSVDGGLAAFFSAGPYFGRVTDSSRQLLAARRWAASTLRGLRPDIVHVHLFPAALLAASMAPPREWSWLLTHHAGPVYAVQGRWARAAVDRWATRRLGHTVAVSGWVRDYLVGPCRLPADDVTLIYNAWGGQPLPPSNAPRPATVVCVANFRPEKGHEVLVRAFAEVARRVPGARLVLVGGGALEGEVRARVDSAGLSGSVDFCGVVPDVWPVLAGAHVFALASSVESMGIAILEAMAAGLPVVATATGGASELVQHGATGWLVQRGDHGEMAERLVQLLADAETRSAFGQAAALAAADKSEPRMVAGYYEIYEKLAAQTCRKSAGPGGRS